jgi:hypothetical protein
MIEIHLKKAFGNLIDIRSTLIKEAKRRQVSIKVTCDKLPGVSIYTPAELDFPVRIQNDKNGLPFRSKINNEFYSLFVFEWKPEKKKRFTFQSTTSINADTEEEAKEIFANSSWDFAANAICWEEESAVEASERY